MYKLHVEDPWLTFIKNGVKTVEGRRGTYEKFKHWIGNIVTFYNSDISVEVKIIDVRHYNNLAEYLNAEGFDKVMPSVSSYKEAVDKYHGFYSDELIKAAGGMCGLVVEVV